MGIEIYRMDWDSKVSQEISEWLRNRSLNQKFIYLWDWANKYYDYDKQFWWDESEEAINVLDWKDILVKNYKSLKTDKVVFIWVACWDSRKELKILESFNNPNILYIWIDFSEEMLQFSRETLKNAKFSCSLIRSDIININLKDQINYLSKWYDKKFFSFLWNTFWNIKPTNIVDLLWNYMEKGDSLLFDVVVKDEDIKSSLRIFNHYKSKLDKKWFFNEHILWGLKNVGFPIDKGEIFLETSENKKIWFYKLDFHLRLLNNIELDLKEKIIVSSEESIKFLEMYFYYVDKLIAFMWIHRFKFVDKKIKDVDWQFLFEKE